MTATPSDAAKKLTGVDDHGAARSWFPVPRRRSVDDPRATTAQARSVLTASTWRSPGRHAAGSTKFNQASAHRA